MINMLIYSRNPWRNNMNIMRPEIRGHKKDPDRTSRDDTKAKPKTTPHGTNSWLEMMPLEKGKATHSSILVWRIAWTTV